MIVMELLEEILEYFNKPIEGILTVNFQKDKSMSFRNIYALEIMSIVKKFVEDTEHDIISFTYNSTYYKIYVTSTDKKAILKTRSTAAIPAQALVELAELCECLNIERVTMEVR